MVRRLFILFIALVMAVTSVPTVMFSTVNAQTTSTETGILNAPEGLDCAKATEEQLEKIRDYYRRNDITGYDVCAKLASEFCPPGGAATSTVPAGGSNAEKLFKFLISKGLTAKQASGIIGNVMQESGGGTFNIDPTITNSIGAYGIVQWLGARKTGLFNYATKQGKAPSDLGIQFDYLWIELTGIYKNTVLDPIKASSDLSTPTKIFLERFEIPCLPGSSACAAELTKRLKFAQLALNSFGSLAPDQLSTTDITDPACTDGGQTGVVDASGYAFPIVLGKSLISNGYSWPCKTTSPYCHHDKTPAFDLSKKPNNQTAGVTVVAIDSGTITKIGQNYMNTGCQSIQYKGDNGRYYWYGHIRTDSKTPKVGAAVSAGTYLGKVGESICTGNGSYPHLHIDMGYPGMTAGVGPNRDPAFIPLMNSLYEKLPD